MTVERMHVLVTGAGGFSGSVIARKLLERGCRVTACVGSGRGRLGADPRAAEHLATVVGDLAAGLPLPDRVDAIVHAAARSPAPGVTADTIVRDNVLATRNLVDYAKAAGARAFIYLSSLSVYGRIAAPIVDPDTEICEPDPYGESKLAGERMLKETAEFRSLAIRLPGVIGKGSVRNWLTGVLLAAREGWEIPVFNPDARFNNATHVDDLSVFVSDLLVAKWNGFDVVTVGAAGYITVRGAVELIIKETGSASRIRIDPAAKAGFVISSERACQRYGYRPMEIRDMLKRFAGEG